MEELVHVFRVLFVAIDPTVVEACRAEFERDADAWDVAAADSGLDALSQLAAQSSGGAVDVVVADFVSPGLANGDFLEQARRRFPQTARVVVSDRTGGEVLDLVVNLAHQFVAAPCRPRELADAVRRAGALRNSLGSEAVRADVSGLSVLPSPPRAVLDVVAALDSPTGDAKSVATAIERDVALSAKILQLTNSSFFAPRSRVTSLTQAVVLMGRDVLRSVMLLDTVGRSTASADVVRHWLVEVNQRSWETAALARRLATPAVAEDAFCAALLLECGQLAFAACRPELFAELIRRAAMEHRHLDELELEAFGVSHSTVGGYLLKLWGFPDEVVAIVANHADGDVDGPCAPDAARVVQAAHQIVVDETATDLCVNRHRVHMRDLSEWGVLTTLAHWKGERHPDHLGRTSAGPSTLMATAIS